MKKILGAVSALALTALAAPAFAADNAQATASANIIAPISVSSDQNLVFGNILAGTGGTVTVATGDARSFTGGVTLLAGTAPLAAHFTVTSDTTGGTSYTVGYTKVDLTNGANPAIVLSAITPSATGTFTAATTNLSVGATITVANGQPAGVYTGSLTATATYQ